MVETDEEYICFWGEEGIEITLEQLDATKRQQNAELSEDELDSVAGSSVLLGATVILAMSYYMYKRDKACAEHENNSRKHR